MNMVAYRTEPMLYKVGKVQRMCRGKPDEERLRIVHQYIVEHVHYDDDPSLPVHEAEGFFAYGRAVCDGISKAAKILLNAVGIPSEVVIGKAVQTPGAVPEGHAWNMVWIAGRAYHMDFTFDATLAEQDGRIHYDYYMLTDRQIGRDHDLLESEGIASTVSADWFREHKLYFHQEKKLREYLRRELLNNSKTIVFRLPYPKDPQAVLEDAKKVVLEEVQRANPFGRRYQMVINPTQMVVTVILQ